MRSPDTGSTLLRAERPCPALPCSSLPYHAGGRSFHPHLRPAELWGTSWPGWELTLAGSRIPAPAHSPVGCRDPAQKDSPGHPWLHTHLHTSAADLPCPSDSAAGKPCSKARPLCLHWRNCERPPDGSHRLWDMPALGDLFRNHSCIALQPETYPVKGSEDFSPGEVSSLLPPQTAFNLSLPHPSPFTTCRQHPQPCCALQRSCSWAELSLGSAACLP